MTDIELKEFKQQRSMAIAEVIMTFADQIRTAAKDLPRSGKRNPFNKSFNRRPRKKQKRALFLSQVIINAALARQQIMMITSKPLPRFRSGSAHTGDPIAVLVGRDFGKTRLTDKINSNETGTAF